MFIRRKEFEIEQDLTRVIEGTRQRWGELNTTEGTGVKSNIVVVVDGIYMGSLHPGGTEGKKGRTGYRVIFTFGKHNR